jgi:hypothetical protein
MHPRFTIHINDARSCTIGKSITFPDRWAMRQVSIQSGRGDGARFMKKLLPVIPFGYRFMTIARSRRCGTRTGAMAA